MKMNMGRHSRQAYIIIKTIHLMNFAKADTLAPIMKMWRSGTVRAWGIVRSHSANPKNWEISLENDSGLGSKQVGRNHLHARQASVSFVVTQANLR
jgi:hypothetical protein